MSLPVCPECGGDGFAFQHMRYFDPPSEPCPACGGSGVDITDAVEAAADEILRWGIKPEKLPAGEKHLARRLVVELLAVLKGNP